MKTIKITQTRTETFNEDVEVNLPCFTQTGTESTPAYHMVTESGKRVTVTKYGSSGDEITTWETSDQAFKPDFKLIDSVVFWEMYRKAMEAIAEITKPMIEE